MNEVQIVQYKFGEDVSQVSGLFGVYTIQYM